MHLAHCNYTYVDTICAKCLSIIAGDHCIHCNRAEEKRATNLKKLLEQKAAEGVL